jgi:thiol-disulfide isomerase/thioredoxin
MNFLEVVFVKAINIKSSYFQKNNPFYFMKSFINTTLFCALLLLTSFVEHKPHQVLSAGIWRATIKMQGQELPFNFEVDKKDGKQVIYIINGEERLLLDEIRFFKDSVQIPLHVFDAYIIAKVGEKHLQGEFVKNTPKNDYHLAFSAEHGVKYRFADQSTPPTTNFSGKWETYFLKDNGDSTKAVGVFEQKGNLLFGTFLTPSGDYRYLEGIVEGNTFKLSTFDGEHLYIFKAVSQDGVLKGEFFSGKSSLRKWVATLNPKASLPDPNTMTFLKEGYDKFDFSFPDIYGNKVSPSDEKFKNKVVVIQILGSWCPNCMDETAFIANYYKKNKKKDIAIIGLAFERSPIFDESKKRVEKLIKRFDIQYDMLVAGTQENASAALPMLNKVAAFPTTIFIDKKGNVRKIHTGFAGPGTGAYYEELTEDFKNYIDKLLRERM